MGPEGGNREPQPSKMIQKWPRLLQIRQESGIEIHQKGIQKSADHLCLARTTCAFFWNISNGGSSKFCATHLENSDGFRTPDSNSKKHATAILEGTRTRRRRRFSRGTQRGVYHFCRCRTLLFSICLNLRILAS